VSKQPDPVHLLHVLTELPQRPPDADIRDLLPFNYAKRQAEAVAN
jgi:transposase